MQPFRCFTFVIDTSPMSQLILQRFRRFTYITTHSTTLPLLHLRHRHFTYVTAHFPTLPLLYLHHSSFTTLAFHLRHSSFSNPSAALPTSQFILQPLRCFTYVIGTSPTSPGKPPMPLWWCLIYPWWFLICNDCGPQDYMKDVNWPSNSKGWRPQF